METEIQLQLSSLRREYSSDFSAMARYNHRERHIRWQYVSGNISDRYMRMAGRPGQGLAGWIIRLGRPIVLDKTFPDISRKRLESPIMIAEKLYSAMFAPVKINAEVCGVLLVGHRSIRTYTEQEVQRLLEIADQIASYN